MARSLRGRLTLVLAIGSVVLVAAVIVGFNVVLRDQVQGDLNTRLSERASAALANVVVHGGRVTVREAPGDQAIDQQVWVFAGRRTIERAPGPPAAQTAARRLAAAPGRHVTIDPLDLRLYAAPLVRNGSAIGAVVAGASLEPYETTTRRALLASAVLGVLVLAGVLVAVRFAINAALRPVDRMTAEAAAWSSDDLDQRFAVDPTGDELARLGSTFNDLLGRLAAALRHEQRFSAELSHELRTPLAKLIMEAELALRRRRAPEEYRGALASIAADARQMQGVAETLLAVARAEINPRAGTSDASTVGATVVEMVAGSTDEAVALDLVPAATPLRLGVDQDVAERVLTPVVANAVRFARSRAWVEIGARDSTVCFVVRDDGPGVADDEREAIFAPGFRGHAQDSGFTGTGLGLALARRLARAADGEVACDSAAAGGRFVVSLPAS